MKQIGLVAVSLFSLNTVGLALANNTQPIVKPKAFTPIVLEHGGVVGDN